MSQSHESAAFACNECQAGMMRLQFITYFTWLDEELVTVPNFPAWVCDVCGKREYDERAVNWLNDKQRWVIERRFGLNHIEPATTEGSSFQARAKPTKFNRITPGT